MGNLDLEKGGYQCFNHLRILGEDCRNCIESDKNKDCKNYYPIDIGSLIVSGAIKPARNRTEYEIEL